MKFDSQICTTREQSERLIALGLKKETADCYLFEYDKEKYKVIVESWLDLIADEKYYSQYKDVCFPAWSLHRLIEMIQEVCPQVVIIFHRVDIRSNAKRIAYSFDVCDNLYDNIIDCIEWLIEDNRFNKDYLEE